MKNSCALIIILVLTASAFSQTEEKDDEQSSQGQSQGPSVDRDGAPVVDPTQAVRELVLAAEKRSDDLRKSAEKLLAAELKRLDDLRTLSLASATELRMVENRRLDELRSAESRRVDEQSRLRSEYGKELIDAEAKRIDAIRRVDVEAVQVASERATQQASVLASQVTASADTLRALVATTAQTFAQQQQLLQTQITERLSQLEKGSYQTSGRASVSDPAMEQLTQLVRKLESAQSAEQGGSEKGAAIFNTGNVILMGMIAIIGIIFAVINSFKRRAA